MTGQLNIVFFGLSITSSWGNGHATTYRSLVRALSARGHHVVFLERDVPWYAKHRDLPSPPYGETHLYESISEIKNRFTRTVQEADLCIVGSYVPDGVTLGEWVTRTTNGVSAFYDIDTPVTFAKLKREELSYINRHLIPRYNLYLSFAGGPFLSKIEKDFGAPMARPLYCSVDAQLYFPEPTKIEWDLGYMGTFSEDRQPALDLLLIEVARKCSNRKFAVAGSMYPRVNDWPKNVQYLNHVIPAEHRNFYCSQNFTLNLTRADMIEAGYSPSVRLFEAAACGTPIISDYWEGLDEFFEVGQEILVASSTSEVIDCLNETSNTHRTQIGENARRRVLALHTAEQRAIELEGYVDEVVGSPALGREPTLEQVGI